MIKFNKRNVIDTETGIKASVKYSFGKDIHGQNRVWIYENNCGQNLLKIFAKAVNNSDMMADYIEASKVSFFEDDQYYAASLIRALA